jgi:hypothetical protein
LADFSMFVNGSGWKKQSLQRTFHIDASYQVSNHLAKRFQRFKKINQSKTRIACSGHVCQRIETKWAIFAKDFP